MAETRGESLLIAAVLALLAAPARAGEFSLVYPTRHSFFALACANAYGLSTGGGLEHLGVIATKES